MIWDHRKTLLAQEGDYTDLSLALPRARWFLGLQWAVVLVAAGGDAANFYMALAAVGKTMNSWMLTLTIGALTVAAVANMYAVGVSSRNHKAVGRNAWLSPGPILLTVSWLLLGLAAFGLRMEDATTTGTRSHRLAGGTAEATATLNLASLALSMMMLCLYLATGALAAWFAFHQHNPFYSAARRARKALDRVNRELAARRVAELWHADQVALLEAEIEREQARKSEDLAICAAVGVKLKESARTELATGLRDPASSSALTSTDLPRPRAPQPQHASSDEPTPISEYQS